MEVPLRGLGRVVPTSGTAHLLSLMTRTNIALMSIRMWHKSGSFQTSFQRQEKLRTKQQKELFQPLSLTLHIREANSSLLQQKQQLVQSFLDVCPRTHWTWKAGRPSSPAVTRNWLPTLPRYVWEWRKATLFSTPWLVFRRMTSVG